jgi:hypothetical protein
MFVSDYRLITKQVLGQAGRIRQTDIIKEPWPAQNATNKLEEQIPEDFD